MGGKPCIRGMRITVGTVVGLVAARRTRDEILREYPYLEAEDIGPSPPGVKESKRPAENHSEGRPGRNAERGQRQQEVA